MSNLRSLAALAATAAIALVAWSCEARRTPVAPTIGAPLAHFHVFECIPFKMTGGGRIDYPDGTDKKNAPASHIYETFGAHVIASGSGTTDELGRCLEAKGSLEWVDHRPDMIVNGRPLNLHSTEITFAGRALDAFKCSDGGAHWGGRLVVKNTGEEADFEVWDCDNGEPGRGNDGFAIRAFPVNGQLYEVMCFPPPDRPSSEPTCTLTGGNRQFHPTH